MRTTTTVLPVVVVFFLFFCCCRRYTLQSVRLTRGGKKIDADSVRAKRNKKKEDEISFFFSLCVWSKSLFFLSFSVGFIEDEWGPVLCVLSHSSLSSSSCRVLYFPVCLRTSSQRRTSLCVCVLSLSHQQYSDRGPRTPPQGLLSFVNYFIDTQASCLLLFLVSCTFSFVCVYRGCDILVGDLVRLITFVSHALFGSCRIRLLLLPSSFWWRNLSIAPFSARTHPSMAAASTIDVA